MKKYVERQNTPTRLFKRLLLENIKAVDIAAANMLHPHEEYPVFVELMKNIKHVGECEGITFISDCSVGDGFGGGFTEDEIEFLKAIEKDIIFE